MLGPTCGRHALFCWKQQATARGAEATLRPCVGSRSRCLLGCLLPFALCQGHLHGLVLKPPPLLTCGVVLPAVQDGLFAREFTRFQAHALAKVGAKRWRLVGMPVRPFEQYCSALHGHCILAAAPTPAHPPACPAGARAPLRPAAQRHGSAAGRAALVCGGFCRCVPSWPHVPPASAAAAAAAAPRTPSGLQPPATRGPAGRALCGTLISLLPYSPSHRPPACCPLTSVPG